MKRQASACLQSSKASKAARTEKTAAVFTDTSLKRDWDAIESLLNKTVSEEPGWISAEVFMTWPGEKTHKIQLISESKQRLDVELRGGDRRCFDFKFRDMVKLSLKGGHTEPKKSASFGRVAFALAFEDGAAVMFESRPDNPEENGKVVDTLQMRSDAEAERQSASEDWHLTPQELTRCAAPRSPDAPETRTARVRSVSGMHAKSESDETPPDTPAPITPADNLFPSLNFQSAAVSVAKLDYGSGMLDDVRGPHGLHMDDDENGFGLISPSIKKERSKKETRRDASVQQLRSSSSSSTFETEAMAENAVIAPPPPRNPALDVPAGLTTAKDAYPALTLLKLKERISLMAIVQKVDACITFIERHGYKMTLGVVDPSYFGPAKWLNIAIWAKQQQHLPVVEVGDAILLRNAKIEQNNPPSNGHNVKATVWSEKLEWVAYGGTSGNLYHSEIGGNAVVERMSAGHYERLYVPSGAEHEYLVKLSDWWRATLKEGKHGSVVLQSVCPSGSSSSGREHQLLSEARIGRFFDMTAEIISVSPNRSNDQITIRITDYTQLAYTDRAGRQLKVLGGSSNRISPQIIEQLVEGSIWSIGNVRLKESLSGFFECDYFGAKFAKLSPEEKSPNAHLKELLKRKEEFQATHAQGLVEARDGWKDSLVSDVAEGGFYTITAELLSRSKHDDIRGVTDLYVTDYTICPCPAYLYVPDPVMVIANGRPLFKIGVWGDIETLSHVKPGSVYEFSNVHVTAEYGTRGWKGGIDHADERIRSISKSSSDQKVLALKRRRALMMNSMT